MRRKIGGAVERLNDLPAELSICCAGRCRKSTNFNKVFFPNIASHSSRCRRYQTEDRTFIEHSHNGLIMDIGFLLHKWRKWHYSVKAKKRAGNHMCGFQQPGILRRGDDGLPNSSALRCSASERFCRSRSRIEGERDQLMIIILECQKSFALYAWQTRCGIC